MANPNPDRSGLRPFLPGNRANPGGRPKFSATSDAMRRLLALPPTKRAPAAKTRAEKLALTLIRRAEKKAREAELVLDRTEGKVPQAITGSEGGPLFPPELADSAPKLFAMTKEQLEELIRGVK